MSVKLFTWHLAKKYLLRSRNIGCCPLLFSHSFLNVSLFVPTPLRPLTIDIYHSFTWQLRSSSWSCFVNRFFIAPVPSLNERLRILEPVGAHVDLLDCLSWHDWGSQGTARVPLPFLEYGYSFLRVDQPSTGVWLLSLSQCPEFDVWSKTHALEKTSLQVAE